MLSRKRARNKVSWKTHSLETTLKPHSSAIFVYKWQISVKLCIADPHHQHRWGHHGPEIQVNKQWTYRGCMKRSVDVCVLDEHLTSPSFSAILRHRKGSQSDRTPPPGWKNLRLEGTILWRDGQNLKMCKSIFFTHTQNAWSGEVVVENYVEDAFKYVHGWICVECSDVDHVLADEISSSWHHYSALSLWAEGPVIVVFSVQLFQS